MNLASYPGSGDIWHRDEMSRCDREDAEFEFMEEVIKAWFSPCRSGGLYSQEAAHLLLEKFESPLREAVKEQISSSRYNCLLLKSLNDAIEFWQKDGATGEELVENVVADTDTLCLIELITSQNVDLDKWPKLKALAENFNAALWDYDLLMDWTKEEREL